MKININKTFLLLTLIILLLALTTVNATKANETSNTEKNQQTLQQENIHLQQQPTQKENIKISSNKNKTKKQNITKQENYQKTKIQKSLPKLSNTITINKIENITAANPTTITGQINDENNNPYNGKLKLKITDINEEIQYQNDTTITNGIINFTFKAKKAAQHKLIISTEENEHYTQAIKIIEFNVEKAKLTLNLQKTRQLTLLENVSISANLVNQYNSPMENITIKIKTDNKTLGTSTTDNNGNINFTQYTIKENNDNEQITIHFDIDEDENVETFHLESYYVLTKRDTQIVIDNIKSVNINETIQLKGKVTDILNKSIIPRGTIKLLINNQENIGEIPLDNNGNFITDLTIYPQYIGRTMLQIRASFLADNHQACHASNTKSFEIFLKPVTTELLITSQDAIINQNSNITIELKDIFNNRINETVLVTITNSEDNIIYSNNIHLKNGTSTFFFKVTQAEVCIISAQYAGNNIYKKSYHEIHMDVKKDTPQIKLNKIVNVTYSVEKNIEGQLTNSYNQPLNNTQLNIKFADEEYTLITDKNGRFSKILDNFHAGINYLHINIPQTDYIYSASLNVSFNVQKQSSRIILEENSKILPGDNMTVKGQLMDVNNNPISNKNITVKIKNDTYVIQTTQNGQFNKTLTNTKCGTYNISITFTDSNYEQSYADKIINITKLSVNMTVENTFSSVGDYVTLTARLVDEYENNVTGGNIVFKANGISLRTDNTFSSNTSTVQKIPVINGIVKITIIAQPHFRYLKNITATYSGTYKHESAKSNTANLNVKLKEATIQVATSHEIIKQHEKIQFTAKITDKTNSNPINQGRVFFKINGVTLKNPQGKTVYVPVVDSVATYNYSSNIMSSVDSNSNLRNYTITAVYVNPDYYQIIRNTTKFNIEKSDITISIALAIVKEDTLKLKATFKDIMGYNLVGENKVCIKINGITYKQNGINKYYKIKDGILDINDIYVGKIYIHSVEIVTGERQAYHGARIITNTILKKDEDEK